MAYAGSTARWRWARRVFFEDSKRKPIDSWEVFTGLPHGQWAVSYMVLELEIQLNWFAHAHVEHSMKFFSLKVISPGFGLYKRHVYMTRTRERVASE